MNSLQGRLCKEKGGGVDGMVGTSKSDIWDKQH